MPESESEARLAHPAATDANPAMIAENGATTTTTTDATPGWPSTTTPAASTTITPNPQLKLPPVVSRLDSQLEFDLLGNPYYKFPPFLAPLPSTGTTLVSYAQFKPSGIVISLDPDEVEVDGSGVETVQLSAKHVAPGDKEKKRRKRKTGKKGDDGAPGPDDIKRPAKWWEDWMEGEDMRRADGWDPNLPRRERFAQGAADFQQGRKWTPPLQSVYDHFRFFVGLKSNKRRRFGKVGAKHGGPASEEEADGEDTDGDDEEELMRTAEQETQQQQDGAAIPTNTVTGLNHDLDDGGDAVIRSHIADIEAEIEAREMRMDAFLNDPELALKIFFSSYYKDKGLSWSVPKLRDGPILIRFFLEFFIRNRLMKDYDRAFNKALLLVDVARIELPLTSKISIHVPDAFSKACVALWGSKVPSMWDTGADWPSVVEQEKPKTETDKENDKNKTNEWEMELERHGAEKIDLSSIPPPPEPKLEPDEQPQQQPPTWGNVPLQSDTAATSADKSDDSDDGPKWGSIDASLPDPWTTPFVATTWDPNPGPPPFLVPLLGPTTLPLTHHVTLVEKSIRRVVAFIPPDPGAPPGSLRRTLGAVVVAPWVDEPLVPNQVPLPEVASAIVKPEILMEKEKGKGQKGFDMAKDVIRVYVKGETVDVMKEGMGMHGIWVRMGEVGEGDKEGGGEEAGAGAGDGGDGEKGVGSGAKKEPEKKEGGGTAAKKRRGKGKGKGKGGVGTGAGVDAAAGDRGAEEDKEWWYLEFLYEVIPSFWTEAVLEGTA